MMFTSAAIRVEPDRVPVACTNVPGLIIAPFANLPLCRIVPFEASTVVVPCRVAITKVEPLGAPLTGPVTLVFSPAAERWAAETQGTMRQSHKARTANRLTISHLSFLNGG